MPPIIPKVRVAKPGILVLLDIASQSPPREGVRNLLRTLRETSDLVGVAERYEWITSKSLAAHMRNDWFNENGRGWWPHLSDVDEVVRKGFIKALDLLRSTRLPIDSYWLPDQPVGGEVFVTTLRSAAQITVLLHTPPSGGRSARHTAASRSMWVTQRRGKRVVTAAVRERA